MLFRWSFLNFPRALSVPWIEHNALSRMKALLADQIYFSERKLDLIRRYACECVRLTTLRIRDRGGGHVKASPASELSWEAECRGERG